MYDDSIPYTPAGLRLAGHDPPPSTATLGRWRRAGIKGQRPLTYMRGGRRHITRDSLETFFAAVTAAAENKPLPPRSSSGRARQVERARADLAADGA